MVQPANKIAKVKSTKSKQKAQEHIVQFEQMLCTAKKTFLEKFNRNVTDIGALSDFEILEQVGSGGFGVVLVAKHTTNNQLYALKLIEKKSTVLKTQVSHVKNEVKLLSCTEFDFLINMEYFFKDNVYLYIGMPFIYGGEMTTHLNKLKKFDEKLSKFYVAQVVLSLEYLHYMGIVYRDLKPENICINVDGYIKICDFGFSKKIDHNRTYSFCGIPSNIINISVWYHQRILPGTPDYLAPEVILHIGYSFSVDFWTLGIFLYEINAGYPPFADDVILNQYDKIIAGKFKCPTFFSKELVDLSNKLIVVDRTSRFGCLKSGYEDIKLHDWFEDIDWNAIVTKKVKPIFMPKIDTSQMSTHFFKHTEVEIRHNSIDEYSQLFIDFN